MGTAEYSPSTPALSYSTRVVVPPEIVVVPTVTDDAAAVIVPLPPREMLVPLTVTDELVSELLPMFDNVLLAPLMVLFVSVSVVARPTSVSVAAGKVRVLLPATAVATRPIVPLVAPANVGVPVNAGDALRTTDPAVPVMVYSPMTPALSYRTRPDVPPLTVVVPTVRPLLPWMPAIEKFQEANVPLPPVLSTFTVRLVPEYAVMTPSMKLDGEALDATRTQIGRAHV